MNIETIELNKEFPFRILLNEGNILTAPHWHREMEIIYVTKGSINFGIDQEPCELKAGQIAFINSGAIHYVLSSPNSERLVYQFDPRFFQLLNTDAVNINQILSGVRPFSNCWPESVQTELRAILLALKEEQVTKKPGYQYFIQSHVLKIIALFIRELPQEHLCNKAEFPPKRYDILEKINAVFDYVAVHYRKPLSLADMAHEVGYTSFHFAKFFKKYTGQTFLTFLTHYRVDRAKWLLVNTELSIKEVIIESGFESDKTFYRVFKQTMTLTASEYRQNKTLPLKNNYQLKGL